MIFLRTLLMFVFVFLLLNISKSNAGKIKNCSNCSSEKANINNKKTNVEETFWQNTIEKYTDTILCIKYNVAKLKNSKKLKKDNKNFILGTLNKSKGKLKLLNVGKLDKPLNLEISFASKKAIEVIEKLGGKVNLIKK